MTERVQVTMSSIYLYRRVDYEIVVASYGREAGSEKGNNSWFNW